MKINQPVKYKMTIKSVAYKPNTIIHRSVYLYRSSLDANELITSKVVANRWATAPTESGFIHECEYMNYALL